MMKSFITISYLLKIIQQLQNGHGAKVNRLVEFSKKTKLLFVLFSLKKKTVHDHNLLSIQTKRKRIATFLGLSEIKIELQFFN